MNKQEYKVTRNADGFSWYFFEHSCKTALQHAQSFLQRNGAEGYTLYRLNERPLGDKWQKYELHRG